MHSPWLEPVRTIWVHTRMRPASTNSTGSSAERPTGMLGDTARRDYSHKLQRFNAFAAVELRQAVADLELAAGMRVLDAGCGTGEALSWLHEAVGATGLVAGIELAAAHVAVSREAAPTGIVLVQGDLTRACLRPGSFDLVWSVNTINHVRDPVSGIRTLATLLRPGGRIAIGQSSLLPDMFFAWDSELERAVHDAVREYYLDRYELASEDLKGVRALVGWARAAGLTRARVRTYLIERTPPLSASCEKYLVETIFRDTWGARLAPHLSPRQYADLRRLCDPGHPGFALRRPDFHFMQTFTLVTGEAPL